MRANAHSWAVVLAGGDGRRVSSFTLSTDGTAIPKQYCTFGEPTCMLRWAVDRAAAVVPRDHVVVVVARKHRRFWERELTDLPPENIIVQPRNRGTATGILLPLLWILLFRDPAARFLVLPSDHFVADEAALGEALRKALALASWERDRLVLLGMRPADRDGEYGWILPSSEPRHPALDVAGFVEKPDPPTARSMAASGALVNSMIFAADAQGLIRTYEEALPDHMKRLLNGMSGPFPKATLRVLYENLPSADFSRDVLGCAPHRLSVLPVPECGWSDLGTVERLHAFRRTNGRSVRRVRGPHLPIPARPEGILSDPSFEQVSVSGDAD